MGNPKETEFNEDSGYVTEEKDPQKKTETDKKDQKEG